MIKYLTHPVVNLPSSTYLTLLTLIAPLINFLSGISIDLYVPSMPAITLHFHTTAILVKNTITVNMIGLALSAIIFGVLFDVIGRRKVLLLSVLIYFVVSCLAPFSTTIGQFLLLRFIQGLVTAAMVVGPRALTIDHFSGHRFFVVMVYTSVAYALGPVLGPFIGGYLQYHFGWWANFYTYAIISAIIAGILFCFIKESLTEDKKKSALSAIISYRIVLTHPTFFLAMAVLSFVIIEQLLYPTIGPFIVQNVLGYSALSYGNTALIVGIGYLIGSILNRFLLPYISIRQLMLLGFVLLMIFIILQFTFAFTIGLNLWTLFVPFTLMNFALGFVFANCSAIGLKLFAKYAGVAAAAQTSLITLLGALGIFIVSYFSIRNLLVLSFICAFLMIIQLISFLVLIVKSDT